MDPERWRRLDALFAAALELSPADRERYLAGACGDDPALREELNALLASHEGAGPLDLTPPFPGLAIGDGDDEPSRVLAKGDALGPYEIDALLGAGGMGEVYRARDPRLAREVAVKVIRGATPSRAALRRFHHEARAAGALNHPNLLAVYDLGVQDGVPYVVTELLEGHSLRERLRQGPVPLDEALQLTRQALAGLGAAHAKGIVHRDLKPENLFVTRDGRLKILDFGLAKRLDASGPVDDTLTPSGTIVGTMGYTAPELLLGRPAEPAADLFAIGAVLYEMVSGRRAFDGATPVATMTAVMTATTPPLRIHGEPAPPALERLVGRCLAKRPEDRFATAAELLAALDALAGGSAATPSGRTTATAGAAVRSLAVLPLLNLSGDPEQEYFCEGVAEELLLALARLPGLRVAARSSSFRFKGQDDAVQRIARELQVETVLEGTLRRAADRSRITMQLVDVSDGCHLWSERYDFGHADVFAVQEEIATRVVEALRLRLGAAPALDRPASLDAYHLYLKGRYRWNQRHAGGLRDAVASFEQAIELDPGYAAAWAGLAQTYAMLGLSLYDAMPTAEAMPRAKAAARRALELEPGRADAHAALGWVRFHHDWDWEASERDFQRAVELDPRHATARHWYSFLLSLTGRFDEARQQARIGWENDPLSLIVNSNLAQPLYYARRFDEAFVAARKVVDLDARFAVAHSWLGLVELARGEHDAAIADFESFGECFGPTTRALALIGHTHALAGRRVRAREALAELARRHEARAVPAYHFAIVHVGLGERDDALRWLEAAADERSDAIAYLAVDPVLDPLRGEPRFARLLDRAGLTRVAARTTEVQPRAARRSVAVLPFRDLAGDPASAHLRLGLADATITELAHQRTLLVRPTSAILRFQDGPVDAAAAGRALGVDSIIDGSFVRAGGRLRVTVQLVSAADGNSSWGTRVEGDSDDLFALQDEVARQVLTALLPARSTMREAAPFGPAGPAYDLYLQGRTRLFRDTLQDTVAAINCFERSREADPSFALAWAGLADAYARLTFNFEPEGDWHRRAQAACDEALRLDPTLPEGLYARGRLRWTPQASWDHAGAIGDLLSAIGTRPGFAEAQQRVGTILYHVGLIEQGELHLRQAVALAPQFQTAVGQLAFCRYHQGHFEEALAPSLSAAESMLAPWDLYEAALCHLRLGRDEEALALARRIAPDEGQHGLTAAIRGLLAALRGDAATAREQAAAVDANRAAFGHYHHAQYDLACIHALLGEADAAVDQLEAAVANGYPCGPFFAADPLLSSLRDEPRFEGLLARLRGQRAGFLALYESLQRSDPSSSSTRP